MNDAGTQMQMWQLDLHTLEQFREWAARDAEVLAFRRALQHRLEAELPRRGEAVYLGFCAVCGLHSHFLYDWQYGDGAHVNWRERLVCRGCSLNNRLRLSMQVAAEACNLQSSDAYLTEHLTPFADALRRRCPRLICSEFLGPGFVSGQADPRGVRHEDLTRLSFADSAFDLVLSFDVFEHIPDYRAALREVRRVLRPGGMFVMSVPLHLGSAENIVRARLRDDGSVEQLMPPEYHGDPVDPAGGILCFYHFGWELLDEMSHAGLKTPGIRLYWS
jgi:SAM-dependent methyltransferase